VSRRDGTDDERDLERVRAGTSASGAGWVGLPGWVRTRRGAVVSGRGGGTGRWGLPARCPDGARQRRGHPVGGREASCSIPWSSAAARASCVAR